jgi:hypothetical protein
MLKADGFGAAIVGIGSVATSEGEENVLVYDIDQMIEVLMDRDKMTVDDAWEYIYFNVLCSYNGMTGPCFMRQTGPLVPSEEDFIH